MFVNQLLEFATLQIKLVALFSFIAVGVFLVLIGFFFAPQKLLQDSGITPPQNESILFVPNENGSYVHENQPEQFDIAYGDEVTIDSFDPHTIDLPFTFSFYGSTYRKVLLTSYGFCILKRINNGISLQCRLERCCTMNLP